MTLDGRVLGRGRSGSSNHHAVGLESVKAALLTAMREAADDAGINLSRLASVTWALAGAGRPEDVRLLESLRSELLPGIPGSVVTDAVAALVGGLGTRQGVVAIAGTGMIVYGENKTGSSARAGGWGHFLDRGSGYHLVQETLRAVARSVESSDLPSDDLGEQILRFLGLKRFTDIIEWVHAPNRAPSEIASLAPIVLDAAAAGNLLAVEEIAREADALAAAVDAVARRLNLWTQPFSLVLAGGLLEKHDFYRQVVVQAIRTRVPFARSRLPQADAAVGAAMLAMEYLGHPFEYQPDLEAAPPARLQNSEQQNILTRDLDLRTTLEIVRLMHLEDRRAVAAVRRNLPEIARAVDAIAMRMRQGGRLIYVGAGTSGRLGALDASECPPTFGTAPEQVVGIIAGGKRALTVSVEAAEDNLDDGRRALNELTVGPDDSVVGVAASGRTPYVAGALQEARRRGALTVALIGNLPAPLAQLADYVIAPLAGPEVITGSTRLKAGTAQKLVLNMLSTGVMIRLGKTYGNLMVEVRPENEKLRARAVRIISQACNIGTDEAAIALFNSDGDVKTAIVSVLLRCPAKEARTHLDQADGSVRAALSRVS
jgi:N-acetylmuramic acid 6-phosphate etherase